VGACEDEAMSAFTRDEAAPAPILKWAGGKTGLISQLAPLFPKRFRAYHEPFVGGAAVFLHLDPSRAHLSDLNERLIDCYTAIREEVDAVIDELARLKRRHSQDHYYTARDRLNHADDLSRPQRAALQIYLNKTCYNGLYRENARGQFNVPCGRYTNPGIFDAVNLRAVAKRLRRAALHCEPFESVLDRAREGDFVYFDPPYAPLSTTSSFTSYTRFGFTSFDQARLREVVDVLDARGCFVLLSNSDVRLIHALYEKYRITPVTAARRINSKADRRGELTELAISNF
jgi:DNA adenine methylase